MTYTKKDYWVDVTVDGVEYHLGCDLWDYGVFVQEHSCYEIIDDPLFTGYLVLDPVSGDELEDKELADKIAVAAQEHLCNVYWNEVLD